MAIEEASTMVWDAERLRIATDAAGLALWSWNVDKDTIALDDRAHGLWAIPANHSVTFEDLSAHIHPEDLTRVRSAFTGTREVAGAYEFDFRIQHGENIRWVSARGQGGDAGMVERTIFGVFLDVTDRRLAEESREMLAGEMSHRIKNLFAIASALTAIAARSAVSTTEMAHDLTQRLTALGRAHDLIHPTADKDAGKKAHLSELLSVLLAPYADDEESSNKRVQVSVPVIEVGESAATTLALIVHELATNSIKYGALSTASGTLNVTCTANNGEISLLWTEGTGRPITKPVGPSGFGTKLVSQSVSGQLGGDVTFDWEPEGVTITMRMSKARLGL